MTPSPGILFTFRLLALTVLLSWVPAPPIRGRRDWAWCAGLALAFGAREATGAWVRVPLRVLTGAAAFLFALHRFPGFYNPVLAEGIHFSADAAPYTLRANADTAVAGIVLMGVLRERVQTGADWTAMLRRVWPVMLSPRKRSSAASCWNGWRAAWRWRPLPASTMPPLTCPRGGSRAPS